LHFQWLLGDSVQRELRNYNEAKALATSAWLAYPKAMYDAFLVPVLQKCTILRQTDGTLRLHSITAKTMLSTIFAPNFLTRSWPADDPPITAYVICTDAYPFQIRYNKKDEKIQATFSFEAVNDVTGAIVLRRIQQLL
jgi:hypothetical protein